MFPDQVFNENTEYLNLWQSPKQDFLIVLAYLFPKTHTLEILDLILFVFIIFTFGL